MISTFNKWQTQFLAILLLAFLLTSCNKNEETFDAYDCTFVQDDSTLDGFIDEAERAIINQCLEDKLTTAASISSNLIGEWRLVGHGEGWVAAVSQPCGYMTISEDQLIFQYEDRWIDTTTIHTWEIVEGNNGFFYLDANPGLSQGVFINVFCNEYMFGDATPADGNMHLFGKED